MNYGEFAYPMEAYGLPSREELVDLRIWDSHYHGINRHDDVMFYANRFGIERVITLEAGGSRSTPATALVEKRHRDMLADPTSRMIGFIRVDPSDPQGSCAKMEKWIRNGPCIGIKFGHGYPGAVPPDHPNNDLIIRLARELKAVVNIHSWIKVGGEPRRITGGNNENEATPMTIAILAERYPDVSFICGHSGGDWELGARAIRARENVVFEFAGSDCHSGQCDYAVKVLGEDRVVWGAHGPSRSWATELSKVLDASLTRQQRMKVFGRNLRRICAPIMRDKGYPIDV